VVTQALIWVIIAFLLGSLPFSVWIGKLFLHTDIRNYGDGAPGASNVARAGNWYLYIISVLLDAFKGTVPVWLAQLISGVGGWALAAVAVAPVLGHAFTPFLKGKGGMGVATTFGVWLGLLGWLAPVIIGVGIGLMFAIQKNWVWASIGGMIIFLVFLIIVQFPFQLIATNLCHTSILTVKRYYYFNKWPELQPWLLKLRSKR
jgi:acyl phosphate:glycerol-3-phosphate acyltransferase